MLLANAKAPQRYKETNTKNSLIQRAPETGEKHQRRAGDQNRFYVTFNKRLGWIVRRAPMFNQFNWQSANKTDEFRVKSSGIFCKRKTVQYKYHLVFVRYFSMSFGQTPQLSHDLDGGKRFTRGYKAPVFVPKKLCHKQSDPRNQNTMPLRSPKCAYFFVFVAQTQQQRVSYIAFQHPNTFFVLSFAALFLFIQKHGFYSIPMPFQQQQISRQMFERRAQIPTAMGQTHKLTCHVLSNRTDSPDWHNETDCILLRPLYGRTEFTGAITLFGPRLELAKYVA